MIDPEIFARFDRIEAMLRRLMPSEPPEADEALAAAIARVQHGDMFLATELLAKAGGDDELEAALLGARIGSARSLGAWLGRMDGAAGVERMGDERGRILWRVSSVSSEPAEPTMPLTARAAGA